MLDSSRQYYNSQKYFKVDDVFNWFEQLFSSESYSKKLFTGSETRAIIVIDDDLNSMSYVTNKLVDILNIPRPQALEVMLRINNEGIAIVWSGSNIEAEQYLLSLREAGIKSFVAPIE